MGRFIFVRIVQGLVVLVAVSVVVFLFSRMTGDPAVFFMSEESTEADLEQIRHRLGLDKPLSTQYFIYISRVIRGDLGRSIISRQPIAELLGQRIVNSGKLSAASVLLAFLVGFPLGVMAAVKKGHFLDSLARVIAGMGQALPSFWVGLVLIQVFSVYLKVLPIAGMASWRNYLMPVFCLSLIVMAGIIRLLRSGMLETLDSEYIKLARIKGVSERWVIWKHAARNSLLSVVSFAGVYLAMLVTTAIAVETIFAWPGLGRLAYEGIVYRDFPVIQGVILAGAALVIVLNVATDVLYGYLDPRIRYT
jgi:peptide/nickel transport system permease protein